MVAGVQTCLRTPPSLPSLTLPRHLGCDSKPSVSLVPETTKFSFTNKKHSHKNLYLSAKDYETLMLGKNLQFFHPISGASMSVRPLITKSFTLTGTPHKDLSREAAVPSYSPLPINHFTTSDIGPTSTLNNSDDEDADHHEVKRARLSAERSFDQISEVSDISMIEAAILDQPGNTNSIPVPSQSMFVFTAMKTHSKRACSRFEVKTSSRHCSTLVRAKVKELTCERECSRGEDYRLIKLEIIDFRINKQVAVVVECKGHDAARFHNVEHAHGWEKDVVKEVEQKLAENKILVSFECESLKADKAAEDHIRQFMPKLTGMDAVVNIGKMVITGLDFEEEDEETEDEGQ